MQAMNAILDLSIEDFEIRDVLKSLGVTYAIWDSIKTYSAFRYSDYDDLLLASSRKALVCFEESEIISLLQGWIERSRIHPFTKKDASKLEKQISPYL